MITDRESFEIVTKVKAGSSKWNRFGFSRKELQYLPHEEDQKDATVVYLLLEEPSLVQAFAYLRRTGSATLDYVLSLASVSPAKRTRHAVGEQNRYRVVVGLAKELAWRRGYHVCLRRRLSRPRRRRRRPGTHRCGRRRGCSPPNPLLIVRP